MRLPVAHVHMLISKAPNGGRVAAVGGGVTPVSERRDQAVTFSIVSPQQHVGFAVPWQSEGAAFVTVTSQPHDSIVQR